MADGRKQCGVVIDEILSFGVGGVTWNVMRERFERDFMRRTKNLVRGCQGHLAASRCFLSDELVGRILLAPAELAGGASLYQRLLQDCSKLLR